MCSDLKREAEVRIILRFCRMVVLAALTTTTFVWMPTAARAGGRCPDIRGSLNPLESSHVMRTFTDIDGCAVPLRVGIGHIPWMQSVDFGYEHIVSRAGEGAVEHEYSAAAMKRWQLALLNAGAALGRDYECHYAHYRLGSQKRTMLVFVDYKDYQGYAYKGITSAYWVPGYRECPLSIAL